MSKAAVAVPPSGTVTLFVAPPATVQLAATLSSRTEWLPAASPGSVRLPLMATCCARPLSTLTA